jgi:hypothetical protein
MDPGVAAIVAGAITKGEIIVCGLACIWMGYRLFLAGIQKGGAKIAAASSRARSGRLSFTMGKGGPGLVFALYGAVIVVVGILHGHVKIDESGSVAGKGRDQTVKGLPSVDAGPNVEVATARADETGSFARLPPPPTPQPARENAVPPHKEKRGASGDAKKHAPEKHAEVPQKAEAQPLPETHVGVQPADDVPLHAGLRPGWWHVQVEEKKDDGQSRPE